MARLPYSTNGNGIRDIPELCRYMTKHPLCFVDTQFIRSYAPLIAAKNARDIILTTFDAADHSDIWSMYKKSPAYMFNRANGVHNKTDSIAMMRRFLVEDLSP